ncbi:MAG: Septum formation protein Maf [Smithella sp. PtaU1.Bin162]|nr:MAG: Septum formation protein Maf [Smithella sp. PtaU1.Bin162]
MPINTSGPLVLASASPRRQELLRLVGLKFKIIPAHINEDYLPGETPQKHVRRLSGDKALAIARKHPMSWVLGADTIVVIDGLILGKPKNKTRARQMLTRLSGREHKVFTGFTLVNALLGLRKTKVISSAVKFKTISPEEREWYVSSPEPYDKAGGYAVQGKGAYFIEKIRGSYTNVIGLPLCEVLTELKKLNALSFR